MELGNMDTPNSRTTPEITTSTERRRRAEYATLCEANFSFIKGLVGPAALYIPNGFADAGLGMSLIIIAFANGLFVLGMARFLDCWRYANKDVNAVELAREMRGKRCAMVVKFSVISLQLGVCVTYFIFVSETLSDVWNRIELFRDFSAPPSMSVCVLVIALLEAPAATVRSLHRLAGANLLGTVFVAACLCLILIYSILDLIRKGPAKDYDPWTRSKPRTSALFFTGIAVFAFEGGSSLVLPIANSVSPADRDRLKLNLILCVIGISIFYALFGAIVYATYGKNVDVIASKVLEKSSGGSSFWPDGAVNLVYLLVVLLSFPLQLLPATQILFPKSASPFWPPSRNNTLNRRDILSDTTTRQRSYDRIHNIDDEEKEIVPDHSPNLVTFSPLPPTANGHTCQVNSPLQQSSDDTSSLNRIRFIGHVQRVTTVIALALIAVLGRHSLDHVVALLGAISCGPLALIVGPYMHYSIATTQSGRFLDKSMMIAGTIVTVMTLAVTLASWQSAQS